MSGWPAAADASGDSLTTAATSRLEALVDDAASALRLASGNRPAPLDLTGTAVGLRLCERMVPGQLIGCGHLQLAQPAFWLPSIPRAVLCADCVGTAPTTAWCDGCGAAAPLQLRRCIVRLGASTVVAFLCGACLPAEPTAGGDR